MIPYQPLAPDVLRSYQEIMIAGNSVLYGLFQRWKQTTEGSGRAASRMKFRGWLFKKMDKADSFIHQGVKYKSSDLRKIQEVRDIEWPLLCGFSRLIDRQAAIWGRQQKDIMVDKEDFFGEGVVALLNAIYCYGGKRKENWSKFITYAHWCVSNRMMTKFIRSSPFSGVNSSISLLTQYQETAQQQKGPASFEAIVSQMGITEKDAKKLHCLMVKVNCSNLEESETDKSFDINSYADYATVLPGINHSKFELRGYRGGQSVYQTTESLEPDMLLAVEKTKLTDWEKTVLKAFLTGSYGWAAEVAANNINPQTRQPYSRAAPKQVLRRVQGKILETYENLKNMT